MTSTEEQRDRVVLGPKELPYPHLKHEIELEIITDPELGLVWGLWWMGGDKLLVVFTAPTA